MPNLFTRGTTATISITVEGYEPDEIEKLYFTVKQGNVNYTKTLDDEAIKVKNNVISLTLTEAETLSFSTDGYIEAQIRGVKKDGSVFATAIDKYRANRILYDVAIS